jgi:hypothetical protein
LNLSECRALIVPANADVQVDQFGKSIKVYLEKRLDFHGYPPLKMTIRSARENMGCATRIEGEVATLGTFGEWDTIEGGSRIRLLIVVPSDIKVQYLPILSGPESIVQRWHDKYLSKPTKRVKDHWYGPASPSLEWTVIRCAPDILRTAKRLE